MAKGKSRAPRQGRSRRDTRRVYILGAALALGVVGLVILLGAVSRGGDRGSVGGPVVVPTPRPAAVPRNGTVYGSPNAAVTITEYLDFQCPVCLRAELSVISEIDRLYVEPGKARFEVKPIAILGDESVDAVEAARCADDQGQFWEYHDTLFANQSGENKGTFTIDNLKRFAVALGLDTGAFNSCLDSNKYESQVKEDTLAARGLPDFRGTPTIYVGAQKVETSVDAIKAAIETALAGGS
jgi:protein-disulfide isomerase